MQNKNKFKILENDLNSFSIENYSNLIKLYKKKYTFAIFHKIPWQQKFVLWRHDCDFSLNRAFKLAQIESRHKIQATYFINIHCEFYNVYEKSQYNLIMKILEMGHQIGIHLDLDFYSIKDEQQLNKALKKECEIFISLFGFIPKVFSFHNPTSVKSNFDKMKYAGLINCYAKKILKKIHYCSDSNGYWRFNNPADLLKNPSIKYIQILTHPVWWQDNALAPRDRVFRSIFTRARNYIDKYDHDLIQFERKNNSGFNDVLLLIKKCLPKKNYAYDFLLNSENYNIIVNDLCHEIEYELLRFFKNYFVKKFKKKQSNLQQIFSDLNINSINLFKIFFNQINLRSYPDEKKRFERFFIIIKDLSFKSIVSKRLEDVFFLIYFYSHIKSSTYKTFLKENILDNKLSNKENFTNHEIEIINILVKEGILIE